VVVCACLFFVFALIALDVGFDDFDTIFAIFRIFEINSVAAVRRRSILEGVLGSGVHPLGAVVACTEPLYDLNLSLQYICLL
jgi:hypothetical protein